jgi:hypothetical protein
VRENQKAFPLTRCNFILFFLGAFWLSAIAAFAYLATYDLTPGNQGVQPSSWPVASRIVPAKRKCNAIVFLHPRCFCSLATANELAKIMTREGDRLQVHVLVRPTVCADEASSGTASTANLQDSSTTKSGTSFETSSTLNTQLSNQDSSSRLIKTIDSIPGIIRKTDVSGQEAKLFGAKTSGDVLLFGANGNLIFAGGITASRGHEGDNNGADAMLKAIDDSRRATVSTTPVFGCSLEEI